MGDRWNSGCPEIETWHRHSKLFYNIQLSLKTVLKYFRVCFDSSDPPQPIQEYTNELEGALEHAARFLDQNMLPSGTELVPPRAVRFLRAQTRREEQAFSLASDRDLVYITDISGCNLFVRLWRNPWCKKIERLAILVHDWFDDEDIEWGSSFIDQYAKALVPDPGNPFSAFLGSNLKEIMLVYRLDGFPWNSSAEHPWCMYVLSRCLWFRRLRGVLQRNHKRPGLQL